MTSSASPPTCPATAPRPASRSPSTRRPRRRRADRARDARRPGDRRRVVARRLRRDGGRGALAGRGAGLVLAGATAEPRGPRSVLFRALAGALRPTPERWLDRGKTWLFRLALSGRGRATRSSPTASTRRAGAVAVRALVGERFRPRLAALPRPDAPHQRRARPVLPRRGERSFAAVAARPAAGPDPAAPGHLLEPRSPGRVHGRRPGVRHGAFPPPRTEHGRGRSGPPRILD